MDITFILASVFGYIGMLLLFIQVTFGTRHVFKYVTTDTVLVNKIHKYIGIYGTLFVFIHPLLEMWIRTEPLLWIILGGFATESQVHITFGRIAFMLLLIVWVTSAVVREKMKWRPWKYLHLLSYPIVFFSFIHIRDLGTFFLMYPVLQYVWAIMFALFGFVVLVRLLAWSGITKTGFVLKNRTMVGSDIQLITLEPKNKKLTSNIGQHFYLQARRFGSEHPFTIIRNIDGTLTFGIRRVGGFWDELFALGIGDTVYVDGPYGVFTREAQNTNPKVIISAGIGATPFIDLVEDFGENAVYFNCNRCGGEIIERELLQSKAAQYIDILDDVRGYERGVASGSIIEGRLSVDVIKQKLGDRFATLPYFICGSPNFIKFIKNSLKDAGAPGSKIYYEELGF